MASPSAIPSVTIPSAPSVPPFIVSIEETKSKHFIPCLVNGLPFAFLTTPLSCVGPLKINLEGRHIICLEKLTSTGYKSHISLAGRSIIAFNHFNSAKITVTTKEHAAFLGAELGFKEEGKDAYIGESTINADEHVLVSGVQGADISLEGYSVNKRDSRGRSWKAYASLAEDSNLQDNILPLGDVSDLAKNEQHRAAKLAFERIRVLFKTAIANKDSKQLSTAFTELFKEMEDRQLLVNRPFLYKLNIWK